jgi:hypothetical protein
MHGIDAEAKTFGACKRVKIVSEMFRLEIGPCSCSIDRLQEQAQVKASDADAIGHFTMPYKEPSPPPPPPPSSSPSPVKDHMGKILKD